MLLLQVFKKSEDVLDILLLLKESFSYFLGLLVWNDVCPSLHFGHILFLAFCATFVLLIIFFFSGEGADSEKGHSEDHRKTKLNWDRDFPSCWGNEVCTCVCLSVIFFLGGRREYEEVVLEPEGSRWTPVVFLWRWEYLEKVKRECVWVCVCACACAPLFGSVTRESSSSAFHLFILMI